MAISWILVAHRAGARVFESRGPAGEIELVREIDHAVGRAHDRDIDTDRAGTGVQGTHDYEVAGSARTELDLAPGCRFVAGLPIGSE